MFATVKNVNPILQISPSCEAMNFNFKPKRQIIDHSHSRQVSLRLRDNTSWTFQKEVASQQRSLEKPKLKPINTDLEAVFNNIMNRDIPTNRKSPRLSRLMLSPKQTELMMEEGNYPLTTETLHEDPEREIQVMEED